MGRKPFLKQNKINSDRILKAYQVHKTVRRTAQALGINRATATKALKDLGAELMPKGGEWQRHLPKEGNKFSQFKKWIDDNPGVKVPKSPSEAAELTGVSANIIKCYLYRLRKQKRDSIKELPDLRESRVFLEDTLGRTYLTKDFVSYKLAFDRYTFALIIRAVLRGGEDVEFRIYDVKKLADEVKRNSYNAQETSEHS